uniref:Uncharacterized protein n=1 Tax=Anguilla anguilla TaxID=7936 RepID=A0A0E9TAL5_ANGAN
MTEQTVHLYHNQSQWRMRWPRLKGQNMTKGP